ncbi:MAG TPA: hypothetical protein VLH94_03370 [Spirochaetia bacterium]|nr:hypothetical protein [Spirochaetia bacterium]
MQGETSVSPEMTLAQKVAAARQESVAKVMSKDAERQEKSEAKKAEREAKRAERERKLKEAKEKAVQKVKDFREWDKKTMLTMFGEIGAAPKIAEIGVVTGVEATKKFAVDRKDEVVAKGKEIGYWVDERGAEIESFVETTANSISESVDRGVENTKRAYAETKQEITDSFVEAKNTVVEKYEKGKDGLKKLWNRARAVPLDMLNEVDEKRVAKMTEKLQRDQEKRDEIAARAAERRAKSAGLKGTRNDLARAFTA